VACRYLKELNPDVRGTHRNLPLGEETGSPGYWKRILEEEEKVSSGTAMEEDDEAGNSKKTTTNLLVVASDLIPSLLEALSEACYDSGHPLIVVTSYGLIGCVRLQLPRKGAVLLQPKPTNSPPDLRLVTSFPAFRRFVDSTVGGRLLEAMNGQQHGHVPYPVLLTKAMDSYHEARSNEKASGSNNKDSTNHNGRILPKTFAEKEDFKINYVKSLARDYGKELNFQEAVDNAYLAYTERDLGWEVTEEGDSTNKNARATKLGQLKYALRTFMEEHPDHRPPINGSVPDMTASTELYVRLQQLYRDQAEEDLRKMTEILRKQQQEEEQSGDGFETVTDEDLSNFCANVYTVGHLRTRSLKAEYNNDNDNNAGEDEELVDDWKMALDDPCDTPVHTPFLWYLGIRACQIFCHREGRYPGCVEACGETDGESSSSTTKVKLEKDAFLLSNIMKDTVVPHYRLTDQKLLQSHSGSIDSICRELTRYGNAEIHTVSSVVGGVASQEAVKIVTGQYVPLDNTYVYNGIVSVGGVYRF